MFWNKSIKNKFIEIEKLYNLSFINRDTRLVCADGDKELCYQNEVLKIENNPWGIFYNELNIVNSKDLIFKFNIENIGDLKLKIAFLLKDKDGIEYWSDVRKIKGKQLCSFKISDLGKAPWEKENKNVTENTEIKKYGVYVISKDIKFKIEDVCIFREYKGDLSSYNFTSMNNILNNSFLSSENSSICKLEHSENVWNFKSEEFSDLKIEFPRFISVNGVSGFVFGIKGIESVNISLVDEYNNTHNTGFLKIENSEVRVYFETFDKNSIGNRIKSIIFYTDTCEGVFEIEYIDLLVNKVQKNNIIKKEKNLFAVKGTCKIFDSSVGFFNSEHGVEVNNKENHPKISIVPSNLKNKNVTSVKFEFFKNNIINKNGLRGLYLNYASQGDYSMRMILIDKDGNEMWSLPYKNTGKNSGALFYLWEDFFIPDWIDNKRFIENISCINMIFYPESNITVDITNHFFIDHERNENEYIEEINGEKDLIYPFLELDSSNFIKENIKINIPDNSDYSFDTEDGIYIEFDPEEPESSYLQCELNIPEMLNIPKKDVNGIGIYLEGIERETDIRFILRDENGNEMWSNPLKSDNPYYYIPLKYFFVPEWIDEKGKNGELITNFSFNISTFHRCRIKITLFELFTNNLEKYVKTKNRANTKVLKKLDVNKKDVSIVTSDNIVSLGTQTVDNEYVFKYSHNKDSYIIFRYNLYKEQIMDLANVDLFSFMFNISCSGDIKLCITDINKNQIWTDHRNVLVNGLKAYDFTFEDFMHGDVKDFNKAMVLYFEIHINNIKSSSEKIHIMSSSPVFSGKRIKNKDKYYKIQDFNFFGEKEFRNYWVDAGEHSKVEIFPSYNTKYLDYPCLKLEYSIMSEKSEKNWIVMKRDNLENNIDISAFTYICFYYMSDVKGIRMRMRFYDKDGAYSDFDFSKASEIEGFVKINIPVNKIKGSADLKNVSYYEFYIGLDWAKPPVKGSIYFATYSEIVSEEKEIKIIKSNVSKKNKDSSIENLERKLEISSKRIKIGNNDYKWDEIKELVDKNIEKGKDIFSEKDIALEETRKEKKWGLSGAAMFIEPTNLCNLACIMCNHGDNSFERSLGVMKFKDFKKICDEISSLKMNIWEVSPFWMGEPFIHPQITEFIDYLSEIKRMPGTLQHFNIHTNGNVLTSEHISSIVESDLGSILFSIDAAKEDTYRKIRVNGELKDVINNIKSLLHERNKKNKKSPAVILQFIVMDENADEIMDFVELGKSLGIDKVIYAGRSEDNVYGLPEDPNLLFPQIDHDLVFIKSLEPNALTKDQVHREIITPVKKNIKRRPCGSLWRMFSVSWDGNATACCRDDQVKMPVGNVIEEGVENVWYGEKLKDIRLAHILGEFDKVPKCRDCVNWVKYPLSNEEVEEWLNSMGESSLIKVYKERLGLKDDQR